jgi:hypothetical protein
VAGVVANRDPHSHPLRAIWGSGGMGMKELLHPAASQNLPSFITPPGETDVLMVIVAIVLLLFTLMIGILYFRLHALPEQFAHSKLQFEIVCVLALLAMFTHKHIFWIAGLLLAIIDFPPFDTLFGRIANATERIAIRWKGGGAVADSAPNALIVSPSSDGKDDAKPLGSNLQRH